MNIAVDASGGDHAPAVAVQGALWVQSELGVNITLVGDQDLLTGELSGRKKTGNGRTDAVVPAIAGQPEELLSLFWKDKRRGEAGFSRDLSWGKAKGCLN